MHWAFATFSFSLFSNLGPGGLSEPGVTFRLCMPDLLCVAPLAPAQTTSLPGTMWVSKPCPAATTWPVPAEAVVEQEADLSLPHFQMALKQVHIPLSLSKGFMNCHI